MVKSKAKLFSLPCVLPGESLEQMPGFNVRIFVSLCLRKLPGAQLHLKSSLQCRHYQQRVFIEKSSEPFSKYISKRLAGRSSVRHGVAQLTGRRVEFQPWCPSSFVICGNY